MLLSLVIDQWGWFGLVPHPISGARVVAIGLLLGAIALTQLDRKRPVPESHSVSLCDR
jgi:bacterial/archaeal transporter family-2 protein